MRFKSFVVLIGFLMPSMATAVDTLVLARAPQLSAAITSKTWTPFVDYLSEKTGVKVALKVYDDRKLFETDVRKGKVALYFGNPGYGVVGHLQHGYIPLIRSDRKLLEGILVARKDSGISNIAQLVDRDIAFPSKTAFAASLYIRSRIDSDFGFNYQPIYTGSHDNTYRAVLIGKAIAGGGVKRTFESEDPSNREQLNVIYTTPGMKSHPLMVHPDVDEKVRRDIQQAILELDSNEDGKKLLKKIKIQKPVIADYTRDYKPIEKPAIKMYNYLLNQK